MKNLLRLVVLLFSSVIFAQAGHVLQGVGAVNMSMGGASTAQPIDISGALQWNPASISVFDSKILDFNMGIFFSAPELSSSLPAGAMGVGSPAVFGTTLDKRPVSPMPALAMVWGKEDSKHTFGVSAFGISGFGVTFPQETNLPVDASGNPNPAWNPYDSNPINYPQNMGGFGKLKSDYMLLQVGLTWAYEITDNLSIGVEPTVNYAALQLEPNPLASPDFTPPAGAPGDKGYPISDKASAIGFGAQLGLFYHSDGGVKLGVSYKTEQQFSNLSFNNSYLDGSAAPGVDFKMNYPAILSVGLGYSNEMFDFAVDYRNVDYENADGFAEKGWTNTGSVKGFGWNNISILSAGIQYKGIKKLPLRVGYTYSSNPINPDLAFFSSPATAIIKNAFQFGFSYPINDNFMFNGVYHHGDSGNKPTEGPLLNPGLVSPTNPYGAVPGTKVDYTMTTDLIMVGVTYKFKK